MKILLKAKGERELAKLMGDIKSDPERAERFATATFSGSLLDPDTGCIDSDDLTDLMNGGMADLTAAVNARLRSMGIDRKL